MKTVKAMVKDTNINSVNLQKKAYYPAVFLLAFIAANAEILGTLSPFTISLMSALPYGLCMSAFFGSLLGYILFGGMINNLSWFIAIIVVLSIKFFAAAFRKLRFGVFLNCLLATLVTLGSGMFWTLMLNRTTVNIIIAVAQSFLAGALTYFCSSAYNTISTKKSLYTANQIEISSLLVVVAVMLLSLFGLDTGYVNTGRILGILLTLVLMYSKGLSGAITGGVIIGVCSVLYDSTLLPAAGILIIASFFGGITKQVGKVAQLAMFIVCSTTFTILGGADDFLIYQMLDVFVATTLFIAVPTKLIDRLSVITVSPDKKTRHSVTAVNRSVAAKLNLASGAIDDLSTSVKKVSERMDNISAQNIATVYTKTADQVCVNCGFNLACWETSFNSTMNALNSFTKILRSKNEIKLDDMPIELKNKCCKAGDLIKSINKNYQEFLNKEKLSRRVSESRSIAIEQFDGIADMLCEISSELSEIVKFDSKAEQKVRRILSELSFETADVSCIIDKFGKMCIEVYTFEIIGCSPQIIADKISDTLSREFDLPSIITAGDKTKLSFFEKAAYTIEFYTSQQAFQNNGVCGDSYEFFVDAKGYAHLILSDGMGSGKRAAIDSIMTCSLILKLIKAGFGLESALKLINASLIVKSDDESLATLDIAKFDLYMGTVSLYKAGAATTFIKKGDEIFKIDSSSLPIGILQNIAFDKFTYKVNEGDIVLMVSDGVLMTGEDWIESELEISGHRSAQDISERIIREAKRRNQTGHSDDMTVLVAKVGKA